MQKHKENQKKNRWHKPVAIDIERVHKKCIRKNCG